MRNEDDQLATQSSAIAGTSERRHAPEDNGLPEAAGNKQSTKRVHYSRASDELTLPMAKILVVEDDPTLGLTLQNLLRKQNHETDIAEHGSYAIELLLNYNYDLVILDCDLPDIPGVDVCKFYRDNGGNIPILFLTGRTDFDSRVAGLDSGGDDYLCKPFNPPELLARIRALLRRVTVTPTTVITVGEVTFDPVNKTAAICEQPVSLVRKEMEILELFIRNPDHVFSLEAIVERVWPSESEISPHSIRPYIKRLRDKLTNPSGKSQLITVHGYGYKFSADGR